MTQIVPDDNSPFITAANKEQVESALFAAMDHVKMRMRKRKEEEESYRIAKNSSFGWKTAQAYMKDPVFEDEDEFEEDNPWWQKLEATGSREGS